MKNRKRLLALLLSLVMALALCACVDLNAESSAEPSDEASADPAATPAIDVDLTQDPLAFAAGLSAGDELLTVNGESMSADLFLYILYMNCSNAEMYLPYMDTTMEEMADDLMEDSVYVAAAQMLLRQKAAELGCLPTDAQQEEVRADLDDETRDTVARYWGLSPESIEFIMFTNTYYGNLLEAATHEPSGEELDEYLTSAGVFRVKHILLMTVDQATQEALSDQEIDEKKATAEDLLAQLQAAEDMPALFDELMNQYSEDGGLETNPDGYVFSQEDSLVGGFREAALELAEGGLSGIVETDYGYHIMLRLPLTDEDKAGYQEEYRSAALDELMEQWQEEAGIVRSDALNSLNVVSFYERLSAYQRALSEQDAAGESLSPVVSDGVG